MGILEEQLAQDIDHNGERDERQGTDYGESPDGLGRTMLAHLLDETGEETHGDK